MPEKPRVHYIPAMPKREMRVGVYCRVSTNSAEQLRSLSEQVSHFTQLTAANPQWVLSDIYMDIASSKTGSIRREFNRMMSDCENHRIEIILVKNISRFGRDTVEILKALNRLKFLQIRVIFEQEELDTANTDSALMISIIEAIAQAENETRSENIKWGIKQRAADGSSGLYNRKCYGYEHDKDGKHEYAYQSSDNHPAVISEKIFQAIQLEKKSRSNMVKGETGQERKCSKYSSKNKVPREEEQNE